MDSVTEAAWHISELWVVLQIREELLATSDRLWKNGIPKENQAISDVMSWKSYLSESEAGV